MVVFGALIRALSDEDTLSAFESLAVANRGAARVLTRLAIDQRSIFDDDLEGAPRAVKRIRTSHRDFFAAIARSQRNRAP
jgi:hypothetical protein